MLRFLPRCAPLAALALSPCVVHPQPPAQALQPVVVTAARAEQSVADVLAPVTLITREDIERTQSRSLPELLARQPGLQFTRAGGPGAATSIWARGAGSSQVLVLLDGVRLNMPLTGAPVLGGINLDTIERIEIVRGNMSSLYGSEAIGGVIQLFSRGGTANQASVLVEAGSGDSASATGSVTHNFGSTRVAATLAAARAKPFSSIDAAQVQVAPPFVLGANPEDDGNTNRSGTLHLRHGFGERTEVGLRAWVQHNETDFDAIEDGPTASHREDSDGSSWNAHLRHALSEVWTVGASAGEARDDSENRSSVPFSFYNGTFEARNRQAQLQADARLAETVTASFGFDYLNQRGASTSYDTSFSNQLTSFSRNVHSYWFGVTGRGERQSVQINVRNDDYSDVGNTTTWLVAYGYQLAPAWRATAQASSAFRAPSFNDLYFPFFSNPALKPEESRSYELGLRYADGPLSASLSVFDTRTDDLIQFSPATQQPENIARAKVTGVELTVGWRRDGWRADVNATYLDTENRDTGERLLRRAPLTLNAALYYDAGRWSLGGEVGHTDRRSDGDLNTFVIKDLAAYTLVRLAASYSVTRQLRLKLRAENVFDEDYELLDGYNTWGRAVFGAIEWRM